MEDVKNNKKRKRLILIFSLIIALLLCAVCVLGVFTVKLSRMNMYSKNIVLGNNYFLADYSSDDIDGDVLPEIPIGVNAEYTYAEYDPLENDFYSQLYMMYYNGVLSDSQLVDIEAYARENGVAAAVAYANELIGEYLFAAEEYGCMLDVPYISQKNILPNGCEVVSAVMLLRFYGYDADPVDFSDNYLDKGEITVKWGVRRGPNPKQQYAGDPKSEKGGWGCFAPVIIKALNKYLADEKAFAKNLTGATLEEIAQQYIAQGVPVAVWCTQNMEEIDSLYQWQSYDKSETFLYPVHEHCVVLVGFDGEFYYFNDPLSDEQTVKYEKATASKSFNSLGRQAVAVIKE